MDIETIQLEAEDKMGKALEVFERLLAQLPEELR